MKIPELMETIAILLVMAANIIAYLLYLTLKEADLWKPVKVFGIGINWGFNKSIHAYWQKRQQVDPKLRKKIDFYLVSGMVCFILGAVLGALTLLWIPVK